MRERERARARARVGEGQREKERVRIPGRLWAVSAEPHAGFDLMNDEIITLSEIKSQTFNPLSHRGAPNF